MSVITETLPSTLAALSSCEKVPDTDQALIDLAKTEPDAFGRLYRKHYTGIVGYLYRRTGDHHASEDLAAEVFLSAWKALPRYRHTRAPFHSWLLRIATNAANKWVVRQKRSRCNHPLNFDIPAQEIAESSGLELAQRALLAISADHQAVLVLHHVEGLSIQEVAAVVGCREGTVKSRLARARDAMRQELGKRRYPHE